MQIASALIINELREIFNDGKIDRLIKVNFDLAESKIDFLIMGNGNRTFSKSLPNNYLIPENLNTIYLNLFQDLVNTYQTVETKVLDLVDRTSYSYPTDKVIAFTIRDLIKGNQVEIYLNNYNYAKFAIDTIPLEWIRMRNEKLASK